MTGTRDRRSSWPTPGLPTTATRPRRRRPPRRSGPPRAGRAALPLGPLHCLLADLHLLGHPHQLPLDRDAEAVVPVDMGHGIGVRIVLEGQLADAVVAASSTGRGDRLGAGRRGRGGTRRVPALIEGLVLRHAEVDLAVLWQPHRRGGAERFGQALFGVGVPADALLAACALGFYAPNTWPVREPPVPRIVSRRWMRTSRVTRTGLTARK